jgi:hypothetical protein
MGTSAVAHGSPPTGARASPTSRHAPSATLESFRASARRGKKQNILVKRLKTLISMCCSNGTLIRESHQQMSQRLSHLEERQREMHTSIGLETSHGLGITTPTMMMKTTTMRSKSSPIEDITFPSLLLGT